MSVQTKTILNKNNVETRLFDSMLVINTKVLLKRLDELLDENFTNSLIELKGKDIRIDLILCQILTQYFGGLGKVDISDYYFELSNFVKFHCEVK
jgi:hypothetical protein